MPNQKFEKKRVFRNLSFLLTLFKELLPILVEKIAEIQGKPSLKNLKKEHEELKEQIEFLEKKIHWIFIFLVLQSISFIIFIIYYSFSQTK